MKRLPKRLPSLVLATLAVGIIVSAATTLRAQTDDNAPEPRTIVDTAVTSGVTNTLVALVQAADLVDALNADGPFTVFAPTDDAFAKLPEATRQALLQPENRELLRQVLLYHVVPGKVTSDQIQPRQSAETLQGQSLALARNGSTVTIDGIDVVAADIDCTNGVVHLIDEVLLPDPPQAQAARHAQAMVRTAIAHGVPMFNHGNARGCAAIYTVAALGLMAADENAVPVSVRARMAKAIDDAARAHGDRDKAWALRHGLDDAMAAMPDAAGDRLATLRAFGLPTGPAH